MRIKAIKFNIYAILGGSPKKLVGSDYSSYRLMLDVLGAINDYIEPRHNFYFDVVDHRSRDEILFVLVSDLGIDVLTDWPKGWLRSNRLSSRAINEFIDEINKKLKGDVILELEMEYDRNE